jgi:hypothetical protein
MLREK